MEDIEEEIKEFYISTFEKNSDHWVDVIHINDPHNFFTRLTKHRAIVQKIEIINPLSKPSSVSLHNIILFNLSPDSDIPKYARGKIYYIKETGQDEEMLECDIFAMDYGYYKKSVPFKYIWKCDGLLTNLPPLAINCELANCAPKGGTNWGEAIEVFKFYVGNERAKMIVLNKTSSKLTVELYNTSPDDIATLLALTNYTTLGHVHNAINNIECTSVTKNIAYYTFNEMKANDTMHVRVLSGVKLDAFYVADICRYKKYLEECANINYYSQNEVNVDEDYINIGDLVCVKDYYLNKYDRGIIKEVLSNSKALVHFVDLGKDEEVCFMKMKKLSHQCLKMPVLAIYCSADKTQVWDNGLHRFLYPGYEFIITIIEPGVHLETPNIVQISPLNQKLTRKALKKKPSLSEVI